MSKFLTKSKETVNSVLPVMAIVILLGLTAAPIGWGLLARFIVGGVLIILGLSIFLMGVDLGIQPLGEQTGHALAEKKSLPLLLSIAFIVGFFVTVAEPDIQVFGDQIHSIFNSVNKFHLVFIISAGVGLLIMLGLLRTSLSMNIKLTLVVLYIIVFALAVFTPNEFRAIAFDSGGATTGPMTVPFILALGIGVSASFAGRGHDSADNFGLTGITSVGPIIAVLIYGIVLAHLGLLEPTATSSALDADNLGFGIFLQIIPSVIHESALSIAPIVVMLVVFELLLIKRTVRTIVKLLIGLIYAFIGLSIFLVGVNGGFMETGLRIGMILGTKAASGVGWFILLIVTGLIIGAVVVCAEPAVWVLTEQVEALSGGAIKRKLMLVFLSCGASVAIGLSIWRALAGFSIMYILVPGYALALLLMIWCPKNFTGIAFDSGGVASGPITSTFVLSFTIGAGHAAGGSDAFGVIALVAMMPLISIQVMGIMYDRKVKSLERKKSKINGGEQ